MPRFTLARIVVVAVAAIAASAVQAATGTLNVSATVAPVCKFTALPNMTFTIDPSVSAPATGQSIVKYKCTKGTPAGAFDVGGVSNGTTGYSSGTSAALAGATAGNTDKLEYSITWSGPTAFTGAGFAAAGEGSVTLNGSIAASQHQDATPDTYNGSVTLTVSP